MDIRKIKAEIDRLPESERAQAMDILLRLGEEKSKEESRERFLPFVQRLWPEFVYGNHHKIMADAFERVAEGKLKRLIINMPPRHTKSQFASLYFPAWYLGRYPDRKVIQASHTAELSVDFGRQTRNLINSDEYQEVFSGLSIAADSKAAGRWNTNKKGSYFAVGVGGVMTGKGADILMVDDPHTEQDAVSAITNPEVFDRVYDWYTSGPRQRLQPGGAIIIVMCVEGNQRILMGDGQWRPIKEIGKGDEVIGYQDGIPVPKKVLDHKSCGDDDLVEVTSRSVSVRVNRRHPFLVVKGGLKKSAKTGEDCRRAKDWSLEWVQAGDLCPGDTIVTSKSMRSGVGHRPMRPDGRLQMTQEDYWTLGYMWGDGWLVNAGDRGVTGFCVATSDKPDLDNRVIDGLVGMFGSSPVYTDFGYARFDNTSGGRWLKEFGFTSGAHVKRIPEKVFRLRVCDKRAFLRGFFAADGWERTPGSWQIGLCNRELVDDLRLLARTCGVRCSKINEYTHTSKPPNSPAAKEFTNYTCRFADKSAKVELRRRYFCQGDLGRYFRLEDVDNIRPCGRGEVFDITVEGAESFIAEGAVVHNTRWGKRDLTGRLIDKQIKEEGGDEWEVIELPAILPSGASLWPEYWPVEELLKTKESLSISQWMAQYQQQPTSEEGALIKRDWWQTWEHKKPPEVEIIIQSWDTAFLKTQRSDYSACTTWGVFYKEDETGKKQPNLILLDAYKEKLEFPELKHIAKQKYAEWEPDQLVVEKKASGGPLIFELQRMGIPVTEFSPARGSMRAPNDKVARVNGITDLFSSGFVWAPRTRWADEVIEECATFPNGDHDDFVDSTVYALMRYRQGGWIRTELDEDDDEIDYREPVEYY